MVDAEKLAESPWLVVLVCECWLVSFAVDEESIGFQLLPEHRFLLKHVPNWHWSDFHAFQIAALGSHRAEHLSKEAAYSETWLVHAVKMPKNLWFKLGDETQEIEDKVFVEFCRQCFWNEVFVLFYKLCLFSKKF